MNPPAKILAVDDEADFEILIRQRFRREIREGSYVFRFAEQGEAALGVLAEQPDTDLLLLDINMPVMDGLTLLGKIRALAAPPTGSPSDQGPMSTDARLQEHDFHNTILSMP